MQEDVEEATILPSVLHQIALSRYRMLPVLERPLFIPLRGQPPCCRYVFTASSGACRAVKDSSSISIKSELPCDDAQRASLYVLAVAAG